MVMHHAWCMIALIIAGDWDIIVKMNYLACLQQQNNNNNNCSILLELCMRLYMYVRTYVYTHMMGVVDAKDQVFGIKPAMSLDRRSLSNKGTSLVPAESDLVIKI